MEPHGISNNNDKSSNSLRNAAIWLLGVALIGCATGLKLWMTGITDG